MKSSHRFAYEAPFDLLDEFILCQTQMYISYNILLTLAMRYVLEEMQNAFFPFQNQRLKAAFFVN